MSQGLEFDLKQTVVSSGAFGPAQIQQITDAISQDFANYRLLREAAAELETREDRSPAAAVRLGVCYYLLGRFQPAADTLRNADGGGLAQFYLGKALFALEQYPQPHRVPGFYGQSVSLAAFLARRDDPAKFVKFIERVLDRGHDRALRDVYGIENAASLELEWLAHRLGARGYHGVRLTLDDRRPLRVVE